MVELRIQYASHDGVQELLDVLTYCTESISRDFDRWDEPHTRGPGLYFAVVADHVYDGFADPMGGNRWPTDDCQRVSPDDEFCQAARIVAFQNDGAVIVSVDGVVQEQMVRLRDIDRGVLEDGSSIQYADWMGSRHMSALETSVRESVVGIITLSEETGRVSVFTNGNVWTYERDELGGKWCPK